MTLGFHIDNIFSEVGSSALLHSFFSTISFHLERRGWGTRFPSLMNDLYQGKLPPHLAQQALADALTIKEELKAFPPERVLWDIANVGQKPPWGDQVDPTVTSLSNYHRTSTNRVLIDLLIELLDFQVSHGDEPLTIKTRNEIIYGR